MDESEQGRKERRRVDALVDEREKRSMDEREKRSEDDSRLRLFYAVELPSEVRERMAEHIARLRAEMPRVRAGWERTEKLHLTLKFFGAVPQSRVAALTLAAGRATSARAPFTLTVADAGAFPPRKAPRVLWLGLRDSRGDLARLHQTLETECAVAGFPREERSFHPHITIARLREPRTALALAELHRELGFPPLEITVNEIVLMRSELGPGGSRYTALSHHRLTL
jgi:2'-5' RNA ligase